MTMRHWARLPGICLGALVGAVLLPAPAAGAQTTGPPAGTTKTVAYRGARLNVPSSWPVYDLAQDPARCVVFNVSAVYLGAQAAPAECPASAVGVSLAVQLTPRIAGQGPAAGTALDNETARRITAASADGTVEATLSYLTHDAVLAGLLHDLGASRIQTQTPGPTIRAGKAPSSPLAATPAAAAPRATAAAVTPFAATHVGLGFDTCGAPTSAVMANWMAFSPYRSVGIYLGGANRACPDGNLSAQWVSTVAQQGWTFIPIYVGLQAPCVNQGGLNLMGAGTAAADGRAAADDAVAQALRFGMGPGTPIYFDAEAYNNTVPGCSQTVMTFLSGWTSELHAQNFVAGAYGSSSSTIFDLGHAVGTPGFVPVDDIWLANWNGKQSVFGDNFIADGLWNGHQRIHQFAGGHPETYGGSQISIDSDFLDGATAIPGNGPPASLQVFAATTAGQVKSSWQFAPSRSFGDWRDLVMPARAAGSPEIGSNQNGQLQVFVRTTDNRLLTAWQAGPSHPFGTWLDMGLDGQITSDATAGLNTNGTTQVFVQGSGGRVLTSWQVGGNQPFGGWLNMGLPAHAAGTPVVGQGPSGTLQVFVHTTDNRLLTAWQPAPSSPFGGWLDMGLGGQISSDPSVALSSDGTMHVFVQGTGGRVLTSWQVGPNQPFGGWLNMGMPTRAGGVPVAGRGPSGALQVFVHTADNRLLTAWQPAPGQPFGGWLDMGLDGQITSDATVGVNSELTMQVFVGGTSGRVLTSWQVGPNQPFGGWLDLGLPAAVAGAPEVAVNP